MAMREFRDETGTSWQVWPVTPLIATRHFESWLVFESKFEKRRLHPIPDGWERCSDDELCAMLHSARPARNTRRILG